VTSAQFSVQERRAGSVTILALSGEIDMATVGDLRAAAQRSLDTAPGRVVLDFAGVTFCDSQGLSTLISLNRHASATGRQLVLANLGTFMRTLLDITGLHAAFEVEAGVT
jgi:anti-sigma B factor antagonist